MIRQKQDGEDLVFVAQDRSNGAQPVDAVRMNGNTGKVSLASIAGVGAALVSAPGAGTGLGTGPTASAVGSALAAEVTLTTGSGTAAFVGATPQTGFTLAVPAGVFTTAPYCSIEPSNSAAALLEAGGISAPTQAIMAYYDRAASSPTSLVFKLVSNGTPTLVASTPYKFQVWING